jgi:hypothetical protein
MVAPNPSQWRNQWLRLSEVYQQNRSLKERSSIAKLSFNLQRIAPGKQPKRSYALWAKGQPHIPQPS